jgi:hypothetical protein
MTRKSLEKRLSVRRRKTELKEKPARERKNKLRLQNGGRNSPNKKSSSFTAKISIESHV